MFDVASLTVAAELGWKDLIGRCFAQLHDIDLGGNFGYNPPSGLALSSSLLMSLHLRPPPCHFFWWGTIVFDLASLTVAAELGWKDLIGHCFAQLHDMHLGGNFGNNPPSGLALSSSLLMSLHLRPPPCHFFWWGTIVFDLASLTVAAELGWKDLIGHCFAQLHDMHLGGNFGNNPPSGLALSSSLLMSLRQLVASEDGVGGTRGLTAAYGTLSLHPICSYSS